MSPSLENYLSSKQPTYDTHCVCPQGYTGQLCETKITKCGFGHCLNNADCIDGYCHCGSITEEENNLVTTKYAGRSCESESTMFCEVPKGFDANDYYCTNGGTCPEDP